MTSLFEAASEIESSDSFHMSRLLILINSFSGAERLDAVEGLTKLAKLDFLLRYPSNLERALIARGANTSPAFIKQYERETVEATMVRYKYGPWDFRYRRYLNLLVAKSLVHIHLAGRTIHIGVTESGRRVASDLLVGDEFFDIGRRSKLLKTHFDIGATSLMRFIYETFPEITSLKYGEKISEI